MTTEAAIKTELTDTTNSTSTSQNPNSPESTTNNTTRKYAGKYDTVEQLEDGYKNAAKVYQENEDLKKKLETSSTVPPDYLIPEDVQLDGDAVAELKEMAKNSQFSQDTFDRLARAHAHKNQMAEQSYQNARKELRDEDYNVLESYVKSNYAPELVESTLKRIVVDKNARQSAINHRESILNSTVAGMRTIAPSGYHVNKADVLNAAKAVASARTAGEQQAAKAKHIQVAAQLAKQKRMSQGS